MTSEPTSESSNTYLCTCACCQQAGSPAFHTFVAEDFLYACTDDGGTGPPLVSDTMSTHKSSSPELIEVVDEKQSEDFANLQLESTQYKFALRGNKLVGSVIFVAGTAWTLFGCVDTLDFFPLGCTRLRAELQV